jgi:hypothetical protein
MDCINNSNKIEKGGGVDLTTNDNSSLILKQELTNHLEDFFKSSSITGLARVWRKEDHSILRLLRLVWLLCELASIALTVILIKRQIEIYLTFGVSVNIRKEVQTPPNNLFPVVSICNTEPMISTAASEYIHQKLNEKFNLSVQTFNETNMALKSMGVDILDEIDWLIYQTYSPSFNATLRLSFGYDVETMIRNAQLYSYSINVRENFKWYYDPYYGNCYTFNSEPVNGAYYTQDWQGYGLEMDIFIGLPADQSSSLFYTGVNRGLYITLEDRSFIPLFENGIAILPDTLTVIGFSKTESSILPKPYSFCVENDQIDTVMSREMSRLGLSYSRRNCIYLLDVLVQTELFGCYLQNYPPILNATRCQSQEVLKAFKTTNFNGKYDKYLSYCPFECHTVSYSYAISNLFFPNYDYYLYELGRNQAYYERLFETRNVTYDMFKSSFAKVKIFIQELQYTKIAESPTKLFVDFLADLGGLLGIFMGLSVMGFMEIFDLLIRVLVSIHTNRIVLTTTKSSTSDLSPKEVP